MRRRLLHGGGSFKDLFVACYEFDNGLSIPTPNATKDATPNGHDGFTGGTGNIEFADGKAGNTLSYNSLYTRGHRWVEIPNHSDFNFGSGAFSISIWVYRNNMNPAVVTNPTLMSKWSASTGQEFNITYSLANDTLTMIKRNSLNDGNVETTFTGVPLQTWCHLVYVCEGGADIYGKWYKNGVEQVVTTAQTGSVYTGMNVTTSNIRFQHALTASGGSNATIFASNIDQAAFCKGRALTQEDILWIYNSFVGRMFVNW